MAKLLAFVVIGSTLLAGANHTWVQCFFGVILVICTVDQLKSKQKKEALALPIFNFWLSFAWGSAVLGLISLLPLPLSWLEILTSRYQILWSHVASLGITASYTPLSLSPIHTLLWLLKHMLFILVAYLAFHLHGRRQYLLRVLMGIGPLLVCIGIIHWIFDAHAIYGIYHSLDRTQLSGFFTSIINANTSASLIMMSTLITLAFYLHKIEETLDKNTSINHHTFYISFIIFNLSGILLCQARAALFICLGFAYLIILRSRLSHQIKLFISIIAFVSLLSCSALYGEVMYDQLYTAWTTYSHTHIKPISLHPNFVPYPKFHVWMDSIPYINDFYWLGSGRDSFGEVFTGYQQFITKGWISHAENVVISTWSEAGILGVFTSIIAPVSLWLYWWYRSKGEAHIVAYAIYLILAALAIQQLFDFGLSNFTLLMCIAILWGILWSYLPLQQTYPSYSQKRLKRSLLSVLLIVSVLICTSIYGHNKQLRTLFKSQESNQNTTNKLNPILYHPHDIHLLSLLVDSTTLPQPEVIRFMQYLMPMYAGSYLLEARRHLTLTLHELAFLNYQKGILYAPWNRKRVYREITHYINIPYRYRGVPSHRRSDFIEWSRKNISYQDFKRLVHQLPIEESIEKAPLRIILFNIWSKHCSIKHLQRSNEVLLQRLTDKKDAIYADYTFIQAILNMCKKEPKAKKMLQNSLKFLEGELLLRQKRRLQNFF